MKNAERICGICEKPFTANSPNQKYCAGECTKEARKRMFKARDEKRKKIKKEIKISKSRLNEKIKIQKETGVSYGYLKVREMQIPKIDLSAYAGMQTINERIGRC